MEIWKDVVGFEGLYQVSNDGRVKTNRKEMKLYKMHKGYLTVGLTKDKKQKPYRVHRLIAQAFIENPENKPHVNHLDGNKENNHVDNLEWCTPQENVQHQIDNGLLSRYWKGKTGGEHHCAKKVVMLSKNGEELAVFNSAVDAALETSYSYSTIRALCNNERSPRYDNFQWLQERKKV